MNIETIISDVKSKVSPYASKGQAVADVSLKTLKRANGLVLSGVQTVFSTQKTAGKGLLTEAQKTFDKAKADGFAAVAAAPASYLPKGKPFLDACSESISAVNKTTGDVIEAVMKGYAQASAKVSGKPVAKKKTARAASPRKRVAARKVTGKSAPTTAAAPAAKPKTTRARPKPKAAAETPATPSA